MTAGVPAAAGGGGPSPEPAAAAGAAADRASESGGAPGPQLGLGPLSLYPGGGLHCFVTLGAPEYY
jgi:hypothetical protein